MMQLLFISLLLGSMVFANEVQYDFNLTKEQKATATVNWKVQKIVIETAKHRIVLPNISEDMMDYKEFISESIFFEDMNFDGYTDIGVVVGIGYGGVNVFANYYFYDPKEMQFHKYLKNVSNLIRVEGTQILYAPMKSGLGYDHQWYQINAEGRPFLFLCAETSWSGEYEAEMKTKYSFKSATVKVKRAYFYDYWDGKKLESYMRQGERISKVLAMESYKGKTWIKVVYEKEKRNINRWVKLDDLLFEEIEKEK